ncbi:hypothetical protein MUO79_12320 [Candidatus Bathyarchaeota archaeon]|nr:hypothetical protein [Candidatus Bathyarchaeota archaeon]
MPHSIRYHFSQRFCVPAPKAYKWCTDYDPQDNARMHENAKREILRISEDTIILTDTYYNKNRRIRKQKLVQLYPNRLSWISTHLTGPNKYSQFLYEIVPENKNTSRLNFIGLQIEYNDEEKFDKKRIELLASKLRKEDSAAWKLLAKEMERELREKLI